MSKAEIEPDRLSSAGANLSHVKNIGLGLLIATSTVLIFLFLLEAAAEVLNYQKHGRWGGSCLRHEPALGWDLASDCRLKTKTLIDNDGVAYEVDYRTNELGSRLWGDPSSQRPKLMLIGDSFTDAQEVSNEKTYYAHLQNELDVDVFAYGAGGYGTLQQWLKTKQLLEHVRPDIYILQFCSNDFVNNSMVSEALSVVESQKTRPYWQEGQIRYAYPPNSLYPLLMRTSLAFRFLDGGLQRLRFAWNGNDYYSQAQREALLQRRPLDVAITTDLLKRLSVDLPKSTKRFAFNCQPETGSSRNERDTRDFHMVTEEAGFEVIEGVAAHAMETGLREQVATTAADTAHLNERGHALWGQYLERFLRNRLSTL